MKHDRSSFPTPGAQRIHSEYGQSVFRVFNVSIFSLYLVLCRIFGWNAIPASVAMGACFYLFYALAWVAVVRWALIGNLGARRAAAATLDQVLPALALYLGGPLLGPILLVPAFGGIGSGMRFGARYAWISSAAGGAAMCAAFWFSPYWRGLPEVAIGIVLVTVLLPTYAVALAEKLAGERRAFELRAAHFEAASKKDGLTGLLNREAFMTLLERAGYRDVDPHGDVGADRLRDRNAVLLLDLDGFKAINDACGHAAGDEALKSVAAQLRQCVRAVDRVARLGGDEFAVLLRAIDSPAAAQRLARQMIDAIGAVPMPRAGLRLGASIGISMVEAGDERGAEQILRAADEAMYRAKAEGKNRYCMAAAPAG